MHVIYEFEDHHISELHVLYQGEWWANKRSLQDTKHCILGSQICIGLIDENNSLKGFARVLTDYTFKAMIFDVIISRTLRGKGFGDKLITLIKQHPKLQQVQSFELYCLPELQGFYQSHGFTSDVGHIRLMRSVNV